MDSKGCTQEWEKLKAAIADKTGGMTGWDSKTVASVISGFDFGSKGVAVYMCTHKSYTHQNVTWYYWLEVVDLAVAGSYSPTEQVSA